VARAALARERDRAADRSDGGDVVVLDQDAVVERHPMVAPAAAAHRVLLERPPAGRGLARVDDVGAGAAHRFDVAAGERGDARQPLHEVQRRPLGFQDPERAAAHAPRPRRAR
jgi:hypothetical protein